MFGFDRWRADPSILLPQLPGMRPPSPGKLLEQGPGVLSLLKGSQSGSLSGSLRRNSSMARLRSDSRTAGSASAATAAAAAAGAADSALLTNLIRKCLAGMSPSLPDMLNHAHAVLGASNPTLALIRQQAVHFALHLLAKIPDAAGAPEVQAVIDACELYLTADQSGLTATPDQAAATPTASTHPQAVARPSRLISSSKAGDTTEASAGQTSRRQRVGRPDVLQAWLAFHALFATLAPAVNSMWSAAAASATAPARPTPGGLISRSSQDQPSASQLSSGGAGKGVGAYAGRLAAVPAGCWRGGVGKTPHAQSSPGAFAVRLPAMVPAPGGGGGSMGSTLSTSGTVSTSAMPEPDDGPQQPQLHHLPAPESSYAMSGATAAVRPAPGRPQPEFTGFPRITH
jgi:hypothetical protein